MSHGVLFIGYVIVATLLKKSQNWNFKNFAIIQLASLIPFGTFYVEKILRECLNSLKNIWLFLSNTRKWDIGYSTASYLSLFFNITLFVLAYTNVFRLVLVTVMIFIARRTKTKFDDLLVTNKTAKYIAHLIPLLFIYKSVPVILQL
jgi:hypothetical protein